MSNGPVDAYSQNAGRFRGSMANFNRNYMQGLFGKSLRAGTLEALGWHVEGFGKGANVKSFLGRKEWGRDFKGFRSAKGTLGKLGKVGGFGMRALPWISTAYFAYEGYQQEGAWGATKGVAESVAYSVAGHYIMGALGVAAAPLMAAAAIGTAGYMLGEAGIEHMKKVRDLEMGQQDQMQAAIGSAGAATMRQRSLMALNNTHLNGRMALGNEGFLMHRSFV